MNSYGSVSRVSESIYKLLRYMNWVSPPNVKSNDDTDADNNDDANASVSVPASAIHLT